MKPGTGFFFNFLTSLAAVLLILSQQASAIETLRPEELRPGMKGYGLTVFRGTEPERFDVEIISVLRNVFPKQDMILIKCTGMGFEHFNVVSGMSGSPIYIDGKLIGALAYGWSFSKDPIAGVTPIHNMMEVGMTDPVGIKKRPNSKQPKSSSKPGANKGTGRANRKVEFGTAELRPFMTPLTITGCPPSLFKHLKAELRDKFNVLPLQGAGGSPPLKPANVTLKPGSAIGVQLMSGDLDWTAIGTVTHVEDGKVLAFGHPFFEAGFVSLPMSTAKVHHIFASTQSSFKFGSPLKVVGAMTHDAQPCIAGRLGAKADMIPLSFSVTDARMKQSNLFDLNIARHPWITPSLIGYGLSIGVNSTAPSSEDLRISIKMQASYNGGKTFSWEDEYFSSSTSGTPFQSGILWPLRSLFNNRIEDFKLETVGARVKITPSRDIAFVKNIFLRETELHPGDETDVYCVLKPFAQGEVIRKVRIRIPDSQKPGNLRISVSSGDSIRPDLPPPVTLDDLVNRIKTRYRATDLVASYSKTTFSLMHEGKRLDGLPPSVVDVLNPTNSAIRPGKQADHARFASPTKYIITGSKSISVPVIP